MSRVVLIDPAVHPALARFQMCLPGIEVKAVNGRDLDAVKRDAAEAEVLEIASLPITRELLDRTPRVRFIQQVGVGIDGLNLPLLRERQILAANNPASNAVGVAEHTIMLMLALIKRIVPADRAFREGRFTQADVISAGLGDLDGATVGLVGMGPIAQALAARLRGFGSTVVYTSRNRRPESEEAEIGAVWLPFEELLGVSDIVSLNVPLANETRGMMDARAFALMRPGAYLVNTARGRLIDDAALRAAIISGRLAGAALDVFADERDGGNPFADLEQVIVTPHVGGGSRRSIKTMVDRSIANIRRYLAGEPIQSPVPGLDLA